MSVSLITGSLPTVPFKGQDLSDRKTAETAGAAPSSSDRVNISDAGKTQAANSNNEPVAIYWTPHLYPGQAGYIPQPLSMQFDKDGKALKPGTQFDTQA